MKVMHINCVIHVGSTGRIIDEIIDYSNKINITSEICYGVGKKTNEAFKFCYRYEQALYRRVSMLFGLRYGFAPFSTFRLLNHINKTKPDIVHIHAINGNLVNVYKLFNFLKKKQIPTIITNHSEFLYTGNCTSRLGCLEYINKCRKCPNKAWATDHALFPNTYRAWKKMEKAYCGFSNLYMVSVSDYTKKCAESSPMVSNIKHFTIKNGVDTKIFKPSFNIDIKKKYLIDSKKIILTYVTSQFSVEENHLKGGYWFLKLVKMLDKNKFHFIVVGDDGYKDNDRYKNVTFAGRVFDRELLANIYSQSEVTLMFSKCETFGMTCAESLCCCTPVVGFACGGAESISLNRYSRFCEYGNIEQMIINVNYFIGKKEIFYDDLKKDSYNNYSDTIMASKYNELYEKIFNDKI